MREVGSVFQEGFTVGLRPYSYIGPSQQCLLECKNVLPTKLGLEPRQTIYQFEDTPSDVWPFPVIHCLHNWTLLFTSHALYHLTSVGWTHLANVNWGTLPNVADFGNYVVIASPSGQWCLYDTNSLSSKVGNATFTVCTNYGGQLIIGNGTLENGPEHIGEEVVPLQVEVGHEGMVAWTKIGSVDFEYTLGNEVGWAIMPWMGEVVGLSPFGKSILVYGLDGIAKLTPSLDPVPTFGQSKYADFGPINRHAWGGDEVSQLFISSDNELYLIEQMAALSDTGVVPKRLGYSDFISQLSYPIVSFDQEKRHWWIGDQTKCFVFNGVGLAEVNETPSSLNRVDGYLYGCTSVHSSQDVIVQTNPMSFSHRGIKTLMCVESDLECSDKVYGSTLFRYSYQAAERRSRKILVDPRGGFFPVVAGSEISVRWESANYSNFHLSKAWLRFKNTDKTFSRGIIDAGPSAE